MKEMDELSSGIERLKRNSDSQKRLIEQLQKDRAFLIERTRFLGQKLGEAYVIYEEAGKRILDFVDKETAPIKNQIAELQAETKKLSGMEQELKIHSSYLSKIRSGDETLKNRLLETEKAIKKLSEMAALAKTHIDRLREKEAKDDEALESRLSEIKSHFETQLKSSQERIGLKISEASEEVLQDATDSINALAASHEDLKKHLSQTSLFVKQLKINTASLRKRLENAGFARAEIEKRVSGHQASIKELDSAVSKLTRRLESISLEDEKLEKRLAELRKNAEESISSKVGQLKGHVDFHQKKQAELLESKIGEIEKRISEVRKDVENSIASKAGYLKAHADAYQKSQNEMLATRLKAISEDFANRVAKINERLLTERKQMGDIESLINGKIRDSEKNTHSIKNDLEKRLSLHQASIREIDSAISKMARKLGSISLEDEKLEKRLADLRKGAEESISSKVGQLKAHIDSHQKRQAELMQTKFADANELLESRIAGLSGTLDEKVTKINERLAGEKQDLSSRIERQNAVFGKLAKDQHVSSESAKAELEKRVASARANLEETLDSKTIQLKAHLTSHQKRQDELVDTKLKELSDDFANRVAKINERLLTERKQMGDIESLINGKIRDSEKNTHSIKNDLEKRLSLHQASIREIDSAISKMARKLGSISLEDEKLEKRLADLRKGAEESISSKVGQLKAHIDSHQKRQAELMQTKFADANELLESRIAGLSESLDSKISKVNERFASERKEIGDVESLINRKIAESQKTISMRESRLDKEIAGVRKQAQLGNSALSSRIEKQAADFRVLLKEQQSHAQSIRDEMQEKILDASNNAEEMIDSKAENLKSNLDASHKRQAEMLETRMKAIAELDKKVSGNQASIREIDSAISKMARRLGSISLEDEALERKLAELRKKTEDSTDQKVGRLKSHIELADQKQVQLIETKLKAIAEFEKKISEVRKDAEEGISSKVGQLKGHFDLGQKRQAELLEAKLKAVSEDFAGRIAKMNERIGSEKKDITEIESLINEKIRGSQESFDAKLSESYDQIEKRISQVSSHVASEKKAIEAIRASLEREIREEQKALSAKMASLSEKSWKGVSGLSEEVSAEKKSLAEQRAKFSERMNAANQAIARLDGYTKSLDGMIKKYGDLASEKIRKNEDAVSDVLKRINSLTAALEKSGSFSKDLGIRLGRLDSQAYSERKALLEKVKSLESNLKASSLEISGLKKQLAAAGSSKASADKRISGVEALLKQLRSSDSTIASRIEKQHIDFQNFIREEAKNAEFRNGIEKRLTSQQEYLNGLESALSRVVKMVESVNTEDKKLGKGLSQAKEEIMKKLLEEEQSDKKEISKLREEVANLKKDIKQWQEEQIKLYELLKEED